LGSFVSANVSAVYEVPELTDKVSAGISTPFPGYSFHWLRGKAAKRPTRNTQRVI
jgi:hypothetical protein